ncbi:MAG: cysteine peptidase family C39 domain-containing protein, partial [Candidatus Omnitrophota bacterium]
MAKNEDFTNQNSSHEDKQAEGEIPFIENSIDKGQTSDAPLLPTPQGLSQEQFAKVLEENFDPSLIQTPQADKTPVVSNFKQWIKMVAIVVLLVFVPDQVSWAFGYNSTVLYKNLPVTQAPMGAGNDVMPKVAPQTQVAGSVEYLLKQIQDKDRLRVQLSLDGPEKKAEANQKTKEGVGTLVVDTKTTFTKGNIASITQWLNDPKSNVLNCGVYSLQELLNLKGINRSLEEVSVLTISTDLMANIIKVGDPKLKTTLFSINKVGSALGLNYKALKVEPKDELKLTTPFIASLNKEHFVTVKKINSKKVFIDDLGHPQILDRADFEKTVNGFVYAQVPVNEVGDALVSFETVPENIQAFVWGDKWRDLSQNLPGLVTISSQLISAGIQIATAIVGAGIGGTIGQAMVVGVGIAQMASKIATICQMEGVCDATTGFILTVAITAACSAGIGAIGSAAASATAATATSIATSFAVSFAQGFVIGLIKGYIIMQIVKAVSNALCGSDGSGCSSDTKQILSEGLSSVLSAIGGDLGVGLTAYGLDNGMQSLFGFNLNIGGLVGAYTGHYETADSSGSSYVEAAQYQQSYDTAAAAGGGEPAWMPSGNSSEAYQSAYDYYSAQGGGEPSVNPTNVLLSSEQTTQSYQDGFDSFTSTHGGQTKVWVAATPGQLLWTGGPIQTRVWGAGTLMAQGILKPDVALVIGQAAGIGVRIAAAQVGLHADSSFSQGLGNAISGIIGTGASNYFDNRGVLGGQSWGQSIEKWLVVGAKQAVFAIAVSQLESAVVGDKPGKSASAEAQMDFQEKLSQFRAVLFFGTALVISGAVATFDKNSTMNPSQTTSQQGAEVGAKDSNSWGRRFWNTLAAPTGPLEGLAMGGNMGIYIRTGSFGSVRNFNATMDGISDRAGYTVQNAIIEDNMWNSMKKKNDEITGQAINHTTGPGGYVVADYMGAPQKVSNDKLKSQYILQLCSMQLINTTGSMSLATMNSVLEQGITSSIQMLPGALALPFIKEKNTGTQVTYDSAKKGWVNNDTGETVADQSGKMINGKGYVQENANGEGGTIINDKSIRIFSMFFAVPRLAQRYGSDGELHSYFGTQNYSDHGSFTGYESNGSGGTYTVNNVDRLVYGSGKLQKKGAWTDDKKEKHEAGYYDNKGNLIA